MKQILITVLSTGAVLAIAGCGGGGATTTSANSGSSPTPASGAVRGGPRNAAAGELVQITGNKLVLSGAAGDTTVTFTPATPVQKSRTGTLADIAAGVCILATGQKDGTGTVIASTVRVSPRTNGSCTVGRLGSPRPGASPRPGGAGGGGTFVGGEVQGMAGTIVTVIDQAGASQTLSVPTTAVVTTSSFVDTTALLVGSCVSAQGAKDASGMVTATSLAISPAGPSGCFTGRGAGGFGGGFGGGRGNGGGAGGAPAAPGGVPPAPGGAGD